MSLAVRPLISALVVVGVVSQTSGVRAQQVYRASDDGVALPVVIRQVSPGYTSEAMRQRITGKVVVECVVRDDGNVGEITITESLDAIYGLDDQAVNAAKQWTFKPGTREGKPVAVLVTIEMHFALE